MICRRCVHLSLSLSHTHLKCKINSINNDAITFLFSRETYRSSLRTFLLKTKHAATVHFNYYYHLICVICWKLSFSLSFFPMILTLSRLSWWWLWFFKALILSLSLAFCLSLISQGFILCITAFAVFFQSISWGIYEHFAAISVYLSLWPCSRKRFFHVIIISVGFLCQINLLLRFIWLLESTIFHCLVHDTHFFQSFSEHAPILVCCLCPWPLVKDSTWIAPFFLFYC